MPTSKKSLKKSKLRYAEYYDFQEVQDKLYEDSKNNKISKDLIQIIITEENIKLAYRNIKKNKGSKTAGVDNRTIKYLSRKTDAEIINLVRKKIQWYTPQPVKRVEIPKSNGGKRPLGIPTITDRLIQQCIVQVLEPICEAKFYKHSYGFRPNRSTEHAIARTYDLINCAKLHFVVDVDIKAFFDNVNHGKMLRQMWTLGIRDKKLLNIISVMMKAEVAGIGFPEKGTPQGGIISPLLSNIVLNELDWWIASQWQEMPSRFPYKQFSNKIRALKEGSKLKEVHIVRYADDFKIFCRSISDATKTFAAVKPWLKERLGLDVSLEKSKIVNLRKQYSEFLGFEIKAIKSKKSYVSASRIKRKALHQIHQRVKELIKNLQYPKTIPSAVGKFNGYLMGIHTYYCIATKVNLDFHDIAYKVRKSILLRLRGNISKNGTAPEYIKKYYGKSKQLRYVYGKAIIPIDYIKHKNAFSFNPQVNHYTKEGREFIHDKLKLVNIGMIHNIMRNPVKGESIEFNDNRLSLFVAQQGKCAISKARLDIETFVCLRVIPKELGGTDDYKNLILVNLEVYLIIIDTIAKTASELFSMNNLNTDALRRINKLREVAGLELL